MMRFFLLILCVTTAMSAQAQTSTQEELRAAINEVIADANMPNSWWTINIKTADKGVPWYQKDTGRSFIPASNTKLYTSAAAIDLLGPHFRYETKLSTDGNTADGVLNGNLIVHGSGDPVIGGRFNDGDITAIFRAWADSLKSRGIHRIEGSIIGDDDAFDDERVGYGWQWDDLDFWYAAEVGALSFNDNCIDFELIARQKDMPAEIRWEPMMTTYAQVVNNTLTTEPNSSIEEDYSRSPGSNVFTMASRVPEGGVDRESLTVRNPTLYFVHVLKEVLQKEGIAISGQPIDIDDLVVKPSSTEQLFSYFSPPLSEIIRVLNKPSQNLYAEQVLRTLAVQLPVDGYPAGSASMAHARARRMFGVAGVDTTHLQLVDGSGLARQNLVTSDMTWNLLYFMYHHPDAETRTAFYESLPIAGVDGTLSSRMKNTPAQGNVRAKTGTLGNVSALSGYVTTAGGTSLIFSMMGNQYIGSSRNARNVKDKIAAILAAHLQ